MDTPAARVVVVSSMIPPAHSGAGFSALKYAARLDAQDRLAFLLTAAPEPDEGWDLGDDVLMPIIRERTCHVGRIEQKKMRAGVALFFENILRCFKTFAKFYQERDQFAIVHCFSPTWLSFYACLAAKFTRKKLIIEITLLGGDCPESVTHNRARILHQRKMWQFNMADMIVCLSPALKRVCLRAGYPEEKIAVIPRAVNLNKFHPVEVDQKAQRRKELGLPEDLTLFLFVGGILLRKGIDLLLPAFRALAGEDPRVGLVVVGPSHKNAEAKAWHHRILEARDDSLLKGRLVYPGWRMNVHEYMQAADLFVLPSRQEGFPNVLVEAMSSGLPPVALDISGTTESIIEDRKNGYVVREATPEALATEMRRAVTDYRGQPGVVGKRARATVLSRFSAEQVDSAYRRVYRQMLGTSKTTMEETGSFIPARGNDAVEGTK